MSASGILNINKPPGLTSFRVVSLTRQLSGQRRIGHSGTLDKGATGILLVLIGQAVRINEYLQSLPKTYRADIKLGLTTDTYDADGQPVRMSDPSSIRIEHLKETLRQFLGEIQQAPPPYSAVKVRGQPAHRYARAGKPLILKARSVLVYRLDLLLFEPPTITLEVECGKGTYIRSLAHDLGQQLGCGAHLHSLVRTKVGPFRVEDASSIDDIQEDWQHRLVPLDFALGHLPAVTLELEAAKAVCHGSSLSLHLPSFHSFLGSSNGQLCRAYNLQGYFLAILRFDASAARWRPEKVFTDP